MTSRVIDAGTRGCDAAGFKNVTDFMPWVPTYQFMSLYLGGAFGVTRQTVEACWKAGLGVQLNFERAAGAALSGSWLGAQHAAQGYEQAMGLGWMGESPLVFSGTDQGVSVSEFPTCDSYYHAIVDTLGPHITPGAYGPPNYLDHLSRQPWWPSEGVLWQWAGAGQAQAWTTVKQIYGGKNIAGVQCDENVAIKPLRVWTDYGPDAQEEQEMFYVWQCTDADAVFRGAFDGKVAHTVEWIDGPLKDLYLSIGVPVLNRAWNSFTKITLLGPLPEGDGRHQWRTEDFYRVIDPVATAPVSVSHTHDVGATGPPVP